jgi:hypothetical protein
MSGHRSTRDIKRWIQAEEPPAPAATAEVSAEALLADLESSGVVTVADPPDSVRRAYRQAMNRAITERLVPEGSVLRHTGRDQGDLVIRLVDRVEAPPRPEPLPATPYHAHFGAVMKWYEHCVTRRACWTSRLKRGAVRC